jgi:two-component system LytT family response regulator
MFRSNHNSTLVFLTNGETITTSKNLKHFEELFSGEVFIRVSKSFIVNINHVERFCTEDGGTIYLHGGCTAALSDSFNKKFFEALKI